MLKYYLDSWGNLDSNFKVNNLIISKKKGIFWVNLDCFKKKDQSVKLYCFYKCFFKYRNHFICISFLTVLVSYND